ncbi:MAG: protein-L-isoaspartate(D-aspartate) O-methyltransferase [Chloroflexota bacterium]|nr:MAG: protein-L-isoaspartate(D-aspartate) O-methyltransferase [Chloroflexota bacterium]
MDDPRDYEDERRYMVREQLQGRDIHDPRVLRAMLMTPRHLFTPPEHRHLAYVDGPLPIGEGQTISQPYIVALMTQMLELVGDEKVLEVGTGSGYQAAVLALLAREVHTVERFDALARRAANILHELGLKNVFVHVGDGSLGWSSEAPYDAIIVTAAAPHAPQPLLEQLADGGRMVVPVGRMSGQYLECWDRHGDDYAHEAVVPVAFVPLRGQYGWAEDNWL